MVGRGTVTFSFIEIKKIELFDRFDHSEAKSARQGVGRVRLERPEQPPKSSVWTSWKAAEAPLYSPCRRRHPRRRPRRHHQGSPPVPPRSPEGNGVAVWNLELREYTQHLVLLSLTTLVQLSCFHNTHIYIICTRV